MKATTNLENDHFHILKLCDVMERIAHEDDIDLLKIEEIVKIIRGFADGLHHKKEEAVCENCLPLPYCDTALSPISEPMSVHRKNKRIKVVGSLNTKIPTTTVPTAPMPVHTA